MSISLARNSAAAVLFVLLAASASARQTEPEPEIVLPKSPNSAPMESVWDYAPDAKGGTLIQTGPYLISRWGNLVVRGRLEDGKVISALKVIQCGRPQDPATQVTLLGEPPKALCKNVKPLPEGTVVGVPGTTDSGETFELYGQSTGWTMIEFAQEIDGMAFHTGIFPISEDNKDSWGITSLGALVHNENGMHIIYAPGETVKLPGGDTFVVSPVMEEQEVEARVVGDALGAMNSEANKLSELMQPKKGPPVWFYFLFFGVPILILGGLVYGVVRFFRRKSPASPQYTGALPTPREALRDADPPASQ